MLKKKLAIDVRMLNSSGIGTYLKNIVPSLLECDLNIELIGNHKEIAELKWNEKPNVNVIDCNYKIYSLKEQFLMSKLIPNDIDLLWVPHFNAPVNYRKKMLVTIHDMFHFSMSSFLSMPKKLYAKYLMLNVAKKAEKIITVSSFSESEIRRHLGENLNITYIHNGVSSEWSKHNTMFKGKRPYIIYVGNVKPHKNLGTLLKAFNRIEGLSEHDLYIVGKREGFLTEDNTIDGIEINQERVKFTGYLSDLEVKDYVRGADVLIIPSLYEGFGLPPLEAMACRTPVISSNVASLPEICGEAAIYFNPTDEEQLAKKILELLSNKCMQEELIALGLERVNQFNWNKSREAHKKIIKELLEN